LANNINFKSAYLLEVHGRRLSFGAIITIIAKPDDTVLHCHRVLLEYYSSLLKEQSFMQFSFLAIPEDVKVVSAFVCWLYTGRLERLDSVGQIEFACSLWDFGFRIGAPMFVNDVVHLICDYHMQYALEANLAKLVYEMSPKHSTLRALIAHMIRTQGPLSISLAEAKSWVFNQAWHDLIDDGGEIVEDAADGFRAENPDEGPWHDDKRHSYLEDEPDRNPENWIEERLLRYVEHSYTLRLKQGDNEAMCPDKMVLA
jgi:hypothetical protein